MKTYEVWVVRGVLEFGVTVVGFSGLCRYHRTILLGSSNVLVELNDVAFHVYIILTFGIFNTIASVPLNTS